MSRFVAYRLSMALDSGSDGTEAQQARGAKYNGRAPSFMAVLVPPRPRLLVVDDDHAILKVIERLGERAGFEVETCGVGSSASDALLRRPAELAMVDLHMPDANGIELLKRFKAIVPACEVILMTAAGGVASAVDAIKNGARDYLTKPFNLDRLRLVLSDIRAELERRAQVAALESDVVRQLEFCGMLGRSPAMQDVFSLIQRLAPHADIALIGGETGTGKELAARAFHRLGTRQSRPFVAMHCSAMEEAAMASASGGTLFLDEISELTPAMQAFLLRWIERHEVRPSRFGPRLSAEIAIIATSRRNLRTEVAAGRFRDDLFYRLSVVEIVLPALRERREDIPYLTAAFMRAMSGRLRRPLHGLSASAERLLQSAHWPGNVRQLRHTIERACIMANGPTISERELIPAMEVRQMGPDTMPALLDAVAHDEPNPMERDQIVAVLQQVRGNRMAAAKLLGISRRALYRRLERYQIGAEAPPRRAYLARPR